MGPYLPISVVQYRIICANHLAIWHQVPEETIKLSSLSSVRYGQMVFSC